MISFYCPECKSNFNSKVCTIKESFEKFGQFGKDVVEEGHHLRCPKCQNIFKIHLECVGKK